MDIFVDNLVGFIVVIAVLVSVFIEITPVKINPVSKFLEWLEKRMNKKVLEKFDALDEKVTNLENQVENIQDETAESRAIDCRTRILQFGDEVRRGVLHSEDSFDQILNDMTEYEQYCADHPNFRNNKTVLTQEKIREVYKKCFDENNFI